MLGRDWGKSGAGLGRQAAVGHEGGVGQDWGGSGVGGREWDGSGAGLEWGRVGRNWGGSGVGRDATGAGVVQEWSGPPKATP